MDTLKSLNFPIKSAAKTGLSLTRSLFAIMLMICIALVSDAFAQKNNGIVKGKIIDKETKEALRSASVSIPALRLGAISDKNGEFTFSAPAGTHTVEVRYLGYETQTKKITLTAGGEVILKYDMTSQAIKTNEIVVVGLTGEVDRNKLGNTISSISSREVAKVVSPSAIDALSGRVSGLNVTRNSGTPGAGTFITIRGRKSIMGSSEPLYVVDGIIIDNTSLYDGSGSVQYSNRAVDINPQDIESIEILKGASAAAIYGSQAGNGVVLITTKKGKLSSYEKPAQISYTSSYTFDEKAGNINMQQIYGQKAGTHNTYNFTTDTATGLATSIKLPAGTTTYQQDDVPFRTAFSHQQSLTITGGVPQFDYLLNATLDDIQGYVIGSKLKRTSVRANVGISLLPGLNLQTNNNFIMTDNDLPQDGSNVSGILLGALRTPPEFDSKKYLNDDGTQHRFWVYDNPIWTQHFNSFKSQIDRFLHSTDLKWMPIEGIQFNARVGFDKYEYINRQRLAVGSAASENEAGLIDHSRITNSQTNLDLTATVTQSLFEKELDLVLVLGGQQIWSERSADGVYGTNTLPFFNQINAASVRDGSSSRSRKKIVGLFAQLTSTLWNRMSLTLAIRRDGSSTFGEADKFNYFPKVGFSYTLSDESFMSSTKEILNNIRLRGSWGEAGSPSLPDVYATNFLYGTAGFFDPWDRNTSTAGRSGYIGIRQGGGSSDSYIIAGATDIKPERSIEREFGIDLGFFDNLFGIEATYYMSNVYDMILNVPVASSTGYDQELRNAAAMWNRGVEIGLKSTPISNETIVWTTMINYSQNENEITKLHIKPEGFASTGREYIGLGGGFVGINNVAMVGKPLGVFYGYGWLKDENGKYLYSGDRVQVDENGTYKRAKNGGVYRAAAGQGAVLKDYYNRGLVNAPIKDDEMQIIGDPNPDFQLSWRNDITLFQDLTISFLFDGVFGHDVWNGTRGAMYRHGTHGDTEDRDAKWFNFDGKPVLNAKGNQVTKLEWYRTYANGFNINEPHIQDGTFIKLREVTFEYRWKGLTDWNVQAVLFSFSARNLFTITDYDGYDPEVNTFSAAEGRGFDYFTLPQIRSYRFGISIVY